MPGSFPQNGQSQAEDIIADFVSILYSFTAKLYGQRRAKRKTEKIAQELQLQKEQEKENTPQEEEDRAVS